MNNSNLQKMAFIIMLFASLIVVLFAACQVKSNANPTQTSPVIESTDKPTPTADITPSMTATPIVIVTPNPTGTQTATPATPTPAATQRPVSHYPPPEEGRVAYLTFDDGPSEYTGKVLDVLAAYDVKATFFVLGKNAGYYPEMIRRMADEGHAVGNHSYTHNRSFLYASTENFLSELNQTKLKLTEILGEGRFDSKIIRYPGGITNCNQVFRDKVAAAGYVSFMWNCLSEDSSNNKTVEQQKVELQKGFGKDQLLILQHDYGSITKTAEVLPWLIETLKTEGYTFKILTSSRIDGT